MLRQSFLVRPVPRFFFHVHNGRDRPDREGTDLPDRTTMRAEAFQMAGEMLRERGRVLAGREWRMEVSDETGRTVLTLHFTATEEISV